MISSIATSPTTAERLDPRKRLERLEQVCNELWSVEPPRDQHERTRLLRQLDDVERKVASLALKLIVEPDADAAIDDSLCRCERRLDQMRSIWGLDAA